MASACYLQSRVFNRKHEKLSFVTEQASGVGMRSMGGGNRVTRGVIIPKRAKNSILQGASSFEVFLGVLTETMKDERGQQFIS